MNSYPEARRYYMDRAWERRIEFRRRHKKFLVQMKGKLDHYLKCDSEDGGSFSSDSKDPLGEDQGESSGIGSNAEGFLETDEEREAQMSRKLRKINSASIFFHDVDIEEEL